MAIQVLFLRSIASAVVSANAAVDQLSLTQGAAASTGTSIANGTVAATWPYVPGTASTTATGTPTINPVSKGWLFDGTVKGSYATGIWTFDIATSNTSATGVAVDQVVLFLVTATTTAVTKVLIPVGTRVSSTYTPTLAVTSHQTSSVSVPAFNVAANQYLYLEVYFKTNTAGTVAGAVQTLIVDAPSGLVSQVTTPFFTANQTVTNLTAGLSFAGALSTVQSSAGTAYTQALTASLAFVGAISKRITRNNPAGLSFVGATSKVISRAQTASLALSGAVTKTLARILAAATLSFSGALLAAKNSHVYSDVVVADSPVWYWRLNDASPAATAPNLGTAGTASNATYVGTPTYRTGQLLPGDTTSNSFSPAGASTNNVRLSFPNAAYPASTVTTQTIEFWYQPTAAELAAGQHSILSNQSPQASGAALEFEIRLGGTTAGKIDFKADPTRITNTASLVGGTAYYFVFTYDKAVGAKLYINGVLDGSNAATGFNPWGPTAAANPPVYIGTFGSSATNNVDGGLFPLSGSLAEVAFYATVLSAAQVTAHYSAATTVGPRIIPIALTAVLSFAASLVTIFTKGSATVIGNREYTAGAIGTGKNASGAIGTGDNPGGASGNEQ